ncbi:SNF2-related protein [Specibacter sp. AOP5-B1-6]|uniref:SNF2-related protein n=1 Tax=Specibacter sp. AOP5-B1-6 TaxID=3457653 RepID=UPI00402BBDC1
MTTDHHAKYWAHVLLAQDGTTADITSAVAQAKVDLNPHQVEAAAFALQSPLSQGVVLADEVGLGKTIEAGLVLLQLWSRRKRRQLIIAPATLRRQWASELTEKFGLPAKVLDKVGYAFGGNPFDDPKNVLICSYHFAAAHRADVRAVSWDRVVFDEAHQLRNVWKKGNQRAKQLAEATQDAPTLLLTATPLQNSLMELYGLVSVIDPHLFGDDKSFRAKYAGAGIQPSAMLELKERLAPVVKRTLRRQVREYVKFTSRVPITQDFTPTPDEEALYELVSEYLIRENSYALPSAQRALMSLILRKILASSPFAIGTTLGRMADRLESSVSVDGSAPALAGELEIDEDYDGGLESAGTEASVMNGLGTGVGRRGTVWQDPDHLSEIEGRREEAAELREFSELALGIRNDAKSAALLKALPLAFEKSAARGAPRKAVIFTESRRTQAHLVELLESSGYAGQVLTINGVNTEPLPKALYSQWRDKRMEMGLSGGSRASDTKSAIVEAFRNDYSILVATEAAAEGLNLQFCSLVVNFDLPWNPQRIEQRIGRCHRYGQKHDVVVVNFLNTSNEADQRVYELLDEKFQLFSGVFGASDEVLGALASGFDFEKRIADVYQQCRTTTQIEAAFVQLRKDLETEIEAKMDSTRTALLDGFDDEVLERLKVEFDGRKGTLGAIQSALWKLTQHEFSGTTGVEFSTKEFLFEVAEPILVGAAKIAGHSRHALEWGLAQDRSAEFYHHGTALATALIGSASKRELVPACIRFDYSSSPVTVGALEGLKGKTGSLAIRRASFDSADSVVELLLAGTTDDGGILEPEQVHRLFGLAQAHATAAEMVSNRELADAIETETRKFDADQRERLEELFIQESEKLDRWAEDLKSGLELEIKDLDKQLKDVSKAVRQMAGMGLADRLAAERGKQLLERKRKAKRRALEDEEDAIDARRDDLLSGVEVKLGAELSVEDVLTVRWELV